MSTTNKPRKYFIAYPDVVTVEETCKMLRLGRNSVYALLKSGRIRSVRVGSRYVIPAKSIVRFLKDKTPQ